MKKLLLSIAVVILAFCFISCDPSGGVQIYEITFDANGAEGQVPEKVTTDKYRDYSAWLPISVELRKAGYGFAGWSKDPSGGGLVTLTE